MAVVKLSSARCERIDLPSISFHPMGVVQVCTGSILWSIPFEFETDTEQIDLLF